MSVEERIETIYELMKTVDKNVAVLAQEILTINERGSIASTTQIIQLKGAIQEQQQKNIEEHSYIKGFSKALVVIGSIVTFLFTLFVGWVNSIWKH